MTEEDYYNTKRFNSINELQTFRDQSRRDLYKQTSKQEQERIYEQTKMRQEEEDTRRAFIRWRMHLCVCTHKGARAKGERRAGGRTYEGGGRCI